jgi:hypothetical protein
VPRDSRFDWDEKHRDAYWLKGDPMPGGKTCWRDRQRKQHIAQNDRYSSIPIVYARWCPLLPKNLVGAAGHSDDVYIIQVHRVEYSPTKPLEQRKISTQVLWADIDMEEEAPTLKEPGGMFKQDNLRDGIYFWGDELVMNLPNLRAKGFKVQTGRDVAFDVVCTRLTLSRNGANISLKWELAKPGHVPKEADDGDNAEYYDDAVEFHVSQEEFNPYPRTGIY